MKIENDPKIWGCFSFAELPDIKDNYLHTLQPVIQEEAYCEKQKSLRMELCRSEVQVIFS